MNINEDYELRNWIALPSSDFVQSYYELRTYLKST